MELLSIPVAQWPPQNHDPRRLKVFIHPEVLVQVFDEGNGIYRLTVNLLALGGNGRWQDGISWDRLQEIKDSVGFAGQDAVEVYPAAQDVVNVANMRHLWVLPEKLPFAWRASTAVKRASRFTPTKEENTMIYPLRNREEALKKAGILETIRRILERAIAEDWRVDDFRAVVDREVALIDDETDLHNRKARDQITRRELGLSASEILTYAHYARVFIDCDEPPTA